MSKQEQATLFGHPTGLFTLFFAEMWERFSYYGMRALLVLYMTKGFLGYEDAEAYKIYGAYTALVYMTPFFGGMLADRLLGARRAVVLGGLLMAAGHLLMTVEEQNFFFMALALLIVGNGFFKPNISTMVGSMYEKDPAKKDGGFTIFYIGINLGAAMAPLLCGFVGEMYGWHYGFGLATIGMLIGLAVFVMPTRATQAAILGGAVVSAIGMVAIQDNLILLAINGLVAVALLISGISAFIALGRSGLDADLGLAPDMAKLKQPVLGPLTLEYAVYLGAVVVAPVFAILVAVNRTVVLIPSAVLDSVAAMGATSTLDASGETVLHNNGMAELASTLMGEFSSPAGAILTSIALVALAYLFYESVKSNKVERERLWVILVLMFFSMLFWAFFEQAGSSLNLFTDRNVDRVLEERQVTNDEVGKTITLDVNQEQVGLVNGSPAMADLVNKALKIVEEKREESGAEEEENPYRMKAGEPLLMTGLDALKDAELNSGVSWDVVESNVGMGVGGSVIPATTFQSLNAIYIMLLGLPFTALWAFLGKAGREPSTTVKFALGLLQLGLGFVCVWYGAEIADSNGMVGMIWLALAYLFITTGELCLSPVGLSMVTNMAPKRLVSTAMGAWFLATALSNMLAAIIASFTGVSHGGDGGGNAIPVPTETLDVYGSVFGTVGATAVGCAVLCFMMAPILTKWMHLEEPASSGGGH
jgi:proton-dependent oligopeptide transporter, POT family